MSVVITQPGFSLYDGHLWVKEFKHNFNLLLFFLTLTCLSVIIFDEWKPNFSFPSPKLISFKSVSN